MWATCFDLCLGHTQAGQYKNVTKDDKIRIKGGPC